MRYRSKFCEDRSNPTGDIADFAICKMTAVRHLEFLKFGKFNFRFSSEAQYASACLISRRSAEPLRRYVGL